MSRNRDLGEFPAAALDIDASGNLDVTGTVTADGVVLGDGERAIFGAGSDLQIYHNGSHSYISDTGTGNLRITAQNFNVRNAADNAAMITAVDGGAVYAYHNGAIKLQTTPTGADVNGTLSIDGLTVDTAVNNGAVITAHDNVTTTYPLKVQNNAGTGRLELGTYGINNNIDLKFQTQGNERVRITTSGNVGIGTTSPDALMHLSGNQTAILRLENPAASLILDSVIGGIEFEKQDGSGAGAGVAGSVTMISSNSNGAETALTFGTSSAARGNNSEAMRIDSSGNVGIFVTPSAWGPSHRAIEIGNTGNALFSATGAAATTLLTNNAYFNGSVWKYARTDEASHSEQAGGTFVWKSAASGTADTAIAWSESMRIDSGGRISMPRKAVISGRIGSAMTDPVGPTQLKFNLFYTNRGGIFYDSTNGRFTVPVAGKYRVTLNPFKKTGTDYPNCRVLIGKNNSTPYTTNHYGHCYSSGTVYNTLCLNSVIAMEAGDYIVFYLHLGSLYNKSNDQFNDFSIEMIA